MASGQAPQVDQLIVLVEKLKQLMDTIFDKGMTYSKVIIGIGYGGLIAVWSGTRQYLSPKHAMWAALLFVLSLTAYAMFEVVTMLYLVWLPFEFKKQVKGSGVNFLSALTAFDAAQEKVNRRLLKAWAVALALTIPTGFGAAAVLVWGFVRQLHS